ncbi:MAG: YegS/Rv2252/BmrU family lipid kinase [Lachnospiraceae bacterium]|nr:YegS/Rv2252/BmrU family lipid kinase [Lachnospiraceae bacterium]
MKRKKALVLLNEAAGKKKGPKSILLFLERIAKHGYEPIIYPIIPGTGLTSEKILKEHDGEVDLVICIGGDGTLNHVVGAIMEMETRPKIGYIPTGSTNDFSKSLGIPAATLGALDVALNGNVIKYDVGRINDRYFNYTAAFGAFSEISYATDQKLKNVMGYAAYVLNAATNLYKNLSFKQKIRIEGDGFCEDGEYVFGAVCNSVSIGGMNLLSNADVRLDDGKMELLLVRAPHNIADLSVVVSALMRGEVNDPHIVFKQVSNVTFKSHNELEWALDGEYGGKYKISRISTQPKAISIKTGKKKKTAAPKLGTGKVTKKQR